MQQKIEAYTQTKSAFVSRIRAVFDKTLDQAEQQRRHEVFDTLLLAATWKDIDGLNRDIALMLPNTQANTTINYLIQQLREINGFCTCSFSDKHETYQDLFGSLAFPTPETRQNIRGMLRDSMITMIFNKTNTSYDENRIAHCM